MTTEEAIRELFPPKVVKHAKERADEAEHIPSAKRLPKSMPKE